ncbi:hypothetical protein AB1Y20_010257 [Prymnesium parvum]|uniref:Uncharacterized protein n=1 Tax=Prymnesium parvum TaxID=97485 RepID=A0AB34K4D2_PRYPA
MEPEKLNQTSDDVVKALTLQALLRLRRTSAEELQLEPLAPFITLELLHRFHEGAAPYVPHTRTIVPPEMGILELKQELNQSREQMQQAKAGWERERSRMARAEKRHADGLEQAEAARKLMRMARTVQAKAMKEAAEAREAQQRSEEDYSRAVKELEQLNSHLMSEAEECRGLWLRCLCASLISTITNYHVPMWMCMPLHAAIEKNALR